ncbi:MAG: aminopeptidase [Bacteroidales bacterium]|nr:aminopeptidase [Bacteroidales bacterium]MBN2756198.1 aminopeptidase [Bacteroidales bacterium]
MNLIKKIFIITFLLLISLIISNCNLIFYGIEQGAGQIKILTNAKPIKKFMQDSLYPDSLKQKLILVEQIKKYTIDSLGLNPSKNYNTLYDQKGKDILWVVIAAEKYKMKEYLWKFPVLGKLPYKGFFKKHKAINEAEKLKNKGFDSQVSTVSAWSTLGFFKDPILSEMLNRPTGEIARLIIHELTHSTLFIKGDAEFNENLATFVGDEGAKQFLIDKYGIKSNYYKEYIGELIDIENFSAHVLKGAEKLDSLYNKFPKNISDIEKDDLKTKLITKIIKDLDTIKFHNNHDFSNLTDSSNIPNNSFFIGYITYRKNQNQFYTEFKEKYNSDFKKYLNYLKSKYKSI